MSITKTELKLYVETGDIPTSAQWGEWVDAFMLVDPTEVTINQIKSWLSVGGGPKGEFVRFPYIAKYDQAITGTFTTSATTETFIGYFVTEDSLAPYVMSEDYPQDIIKYDASYQLTPVTSGVADGKVLYREDTLIRVGADCDWRVMLFDVKKCFFYEFGMAEDYCVMTDLPYLGTLPSTIGAKNGTAINPQFVGLRGTDVIDTGDTQEMLMFGDIDATNFENVKVELFASYAEFLSDTGSVQAEMLTSEFPAFVFHAPLNATYARKDIHIRGAYGVFGDTAGTTQVRNFKGTFYGGYYRSLDYSVNSIEKTFDKLLIAHPECKRFVGEGSEQKHTIYETGETVLYYDTISSGAETNILVGGRLENVTQGEFAIITAIDTATNKITLRGDWSHWSNNNELQYESTQIYYDTDTNESLLEAGDVITNSTQSEQANLLTINTGTNLMVLGGDVTGTWVNNDSLATAYKAFTALIHNAPAAPTTANCVCLIHNAPAAPTYTAGNECEDKFTTGISANNCYFNGYNFVQDHIENTKSKHQFLQRVVFNGIIKQMTCDTDLFHVVFNAAELIERIFIGALPEDVTVHLHESNPSILSSTNTLGSRIIDDTIDIRGDIHTIRCFNRVIQYEALVTKTPVPTAAVTVKILTPKTNEGFQGRADWKGINVSTGVVQSELDEADAQDLSGTLTVLGTYNRVRTNNNVNATLAWQRTGNDMELVIAHAGAQNGTFHIPLIMYIQKVT